MLAKEKFGIRGREIAAMPHASFVPFTAQTRMSGVDLDGTAASARARPSRCKQFVGGTFPAAKSIRPSKTSPAPAARRWSSPRSNEVLGVIHLKDIVKGGLPDRFERFRAMGIKTVMITGDNPLTAAAIATEAGVDDFLAAGHAGGQARAASARNRRAATWSR